MRTQDFIVLLPHLIGANTFASLLATDFDGVNDVVDAGFPSTLDETFASGGAEGGWFFIRSDGGTSTGRLFDKTTHYLATIDELAGVCALEFNHDFSTADGTWRTTGRDVTLNSWVHITVSYDNGDVSNNPVIKIDNVISAITESSTPVGTASLDAANNSLLGNDSGGSVGLDGVVDDPAIINRVLTAGENTEWYNNGTPPDFNKLSFFSDVVAWWLAGDEDTFPLILDHTDPTFGASLVDANASTFEGSSTYAWVAQGTNTIANPSNALEITFVDDATGAKELLANASDLSDDLTVGVLYRLVITASINAGTATLTVDDGAGGLTSETITTTPTVYTFIFIAASATLANIIQSGLGAGDVVTLDTWSIQEASANHGIMINMVAGDFVSGVNG